MVGRARAIVRGFKSLGRRGRDGAKDWAARAFTRSDASDGNRPNHARDCDFPRGACRSITRTSVSSAVRVAGARFVLTRNGPVSVPQSSSVGTTRIGNVQENSWRVFPGERLPAGSREVGDRRNLERQRRQLHAGDGDARPLESQRAAWNGCAAADLQSTTRNSIRREAAITIWRKRSYAARRKPGISKACFR